MVCLADLAKSNNTYEFEHEGNPYSIKFSNTEIVLIEFGFSIDRETPFKHGRENSKVLMARPSIHEFKHYRENGSKFWTRAAGYDLFFAVPAKEIFVLPYAGYSYPKIVIAGVEIKVSCSGSSSNGGWKDYVGSCVSVGINAKIAKLNAVISKAFSYEELKDNSIHLKNIKLDPYNNEYWAEQYARENITLKPGMKIVLKSNFSYSGEKEGVISGESFGKGKNWPCDFKGMRGPYVLVTVNQIDYVKTSLANGLTVINPDDLIYKRIPVIEDENFNSFANTLKELIGE